LEPGSFQPFVNATYDRSFTLLLNKDERKEDALMFLTVDGQENYQANNKFKAPVSNLFQYQSRDFLY